MFCIAKLIEMLLIQERSLGQIWDELPRTAHRVQTLRCPWSVKGALMRYLVETHPKERTELIDGVKVLDPTGRSWVLVLPDASDPLVHIFADSESRDWADQQLRAYREKVEHFIEAEQGIKESIV